MFDFSHLPQNAVASEYVFNTSENTSTVRPRAWHKPINARLVFMFLIGGGGGGAGGSAGAAGSSRSGGGGGGSGAISQGLFLASSLPSTLYVYTHGAGLIKTGRGGSSGGSGIGGPYVAIGNYPGITTSQPSAFSQYLEASGGTSGTPTSAGGGGFVLASANAALANHAIYWSSVAGRNGTYVANGLPATTSIGTASPILGGGGGGGVLTGVPTVFNGAGFTSEIPAILPDIAGGLASSGLDASSGVRLPFVSVGGAGGGANDNGTGGRGGNGAGYGAGGGGGGAGVTGQGGRGGDGGPAYACIIAW